jgi:predicted metal-dependent peptidase
MTVYPEVLMPTIEERLVKSRVKLLRESPFFGTLLLNAPYRVTEDISTAATDGGTLMLNPTFMESQTQEHFQSILLHEVLHMALEHIERMKDVFMTDPMTSNIAADIVVNGIIRDNRMSLPEEAIHDDDLKHLSVREIYNILRQKQQKDPDYLRKKYGTGDGDVNYCLQPGGSGKPGNSADKSGDPKDGPGRKINWKDILNKAATIARTKSFGLHGAGLKRIFNDLLEPTIDWRDALYKYITASRTDFEGYDRRFIHSGQYLDDLGGGRIHVMVFMDTSGSVDEELLSEFIAELRFAVNALPQISGDLWYFDTNLYHQGDIADILETPKIQGGGGTSFVDVMKKIQSDHGEDSTVQTLGIVFTDGKARLNDFQEPDCPVLWCISPGGVKSDDLPFGEVVRILK